MAHNDYAAPCILISASGMCEGGRILHHFRHNLAQTSTTVLFVGYQGYGSLGRMIVDGKKTVTIFGEKIPVRASVIWRYAPTSALKLTYGEGFRAPSIFDISGTGIGATEMAGVWTEGKLWFKVPSTIRIVVEGELRPWVSAKDLILYVIGRLGADGADYRAVEFDGPAIRAMSAASRMVIANLSMEMCAKVAFTPVDELAADADARYERLIEMDASRDLAEPQVACPHTVDHVKPLREVAGTPVQQAFLGTCTNGRLEDIAAAAEIVRGLDQRVVEAFERGIELVEWTFDPLEIKNAYLNLEKLGAIARRYNINQYGISSSPLQGGLPTDRLVAEWWLKSKRVTALLEMGARPPFVTERTIAVPAQIHQWKASEKAMSSYASEPR